MNLRKPKALRPGDRIGIAAPASAPNDPTRIEPGLEYVRRLGFEPVVAPNARAKHGFHAGTDAQRVEDLHTLFADPSIKAIVCLRGGVGATRLLPFLDAELIGNNPKIFVGYSDITALNAFLLTRCGVVSFYGPMLATEFWKGATPFIEASFVRAVTTSAPYGPVGYPEGWTLQETLLPGKATGRLIGGCLTLFQCLVGTPSQVSLNNAIFYFEDIDSEPYQTDRTLTHLIQSGMFDGVKGIVVGDCVGCEHEEGRSGYVNCQDFRTVLKERFGPLSVPVLFGAPFGHGAEKATLPFGVEATLDADACELTITEAALDPA